MSTILLESFDTVGSISNLNLRGWITTQGIGSVMSLVSGRTDQACHIELHNDPITGSVSLARQVPASAEHSVFTAGFAIKIPTFGFSSDVFELRSDNLGTIHVQVIITNTGQIYVYGGPGLAFIASSSTFIFPGVYYYLEISALLHATAGSVQVNPNDNTIIHATGVATKNGGSKTGFDSVFFQAGKGMAYEIDDFYLTNGATGVNNSFLGDTAIEALRPYNNGDMSQLTNDSGNSIDNYSHVNSLRTQTIKDVQSATAGDEDTYVLQPLSFPGGTVSTIQTSILAEKNNAGTRGVQPVIREAGTDHVGSAINIGLSPAYYTEIFDEDPGTSSTWTLAGFAAAQFGVRVS